jgi:hypothetical protein
MPPVTQVSASDTASRTVVAEFALAYVRQALTVDANESERVSQTRHRTEVSPWLELTRWREYLKGHRLNTVAGGAWGQTRVGQGAASGGLRGQRSAAD